MYGSTDKKINNYINHVVMVIDKSGSMNWLRASVVKVVDGIVANLARRSQELDIETRISLYTFNGTVQCIAYDKDVLRLPSIADYYSPNGQTALASATLSAIQDLKKTATLYGDHSFLVYVITDGQENASPFARVQALPQVLRDLPEEWTMACLVPDGRGEAEAKHFGFPPGNIERWNASSAQGVEEFGRRIETATAGYMTSRASGTFRGTRTLFSTKDVTAENIAAVGLQPLRQDAYVLTTVAPTNVADLRTGEDPLRPEIRAFVQRAGLNFRLGNAYYEHSKRETIQGQKNIAVVERSSGKVFIDPVPSSPAVRALLGLGQDSTRVPPDLNPKYKIFVQSTSVNRKLVVGTELLVVTA